MTESREKTRLMKEFDEGTELFYKKLKLRNEDALQYCLWFCKVWIEYAHQKCDEETAQYILTRISVMMKDAENPSS